MYNMSLNLSILIKKTITNKSSRSIKKMFYKRLQHWCFPAEFAKFFITPFRRKSANGYFRIIFKRTIQNGLWESILMRIWETMF